MRSLWRFLARLQSDVFLNLFPQSLVRALPRVERPKTFVPVYHLLRHDAKPC